MAKDCFNCENCTYIGEGAYACMAEEPIIIIEEHNIPTDDFMWCDGEEFENAE